MHTTVQLEGRPLAVTTTAAADRALEQRETPLEAQMELYFSCLIRLKVRFRDTTADDAVAAGERLNISFRPVMTEACGIDYEGDEPPVTDFPLQRREAFTPHWIRIDYRNGQWQGEFGFSS